MTSSYPHIAPALAGDDELARLQAFIRRHPGASYLRPSTGTHPWELTVPEADGDRHVVAWTLGRLLAKAARHYPDQ